MPREIVRELVYRAYEAYALGHRDFVVDLLDEDVEWRFHGPSELLPVPNYIRGRAALLAAYQKMEETTETLEYKLNLVVVDGEHAAIFGETNFRHRASGRIVHYEFSALHVYANSRLIRYELFLDTVSMARQLLDLPIELPPAYSP
jgi:ketosteroid isomerase-like protein